jgi:hypothetical protein
MECFVYILGSSASDGYRTYVGWTNDLATMQRLSFFSEKCRQIDMKLSKMRTALVLVVSSMWICSCLLLFQGTTEDVNVASDPPGATVVLNDGETKVTPFSITVPREKDLQFHFSKHGYQSADVSDNSRVEPESFVDFFPLVLPWAVDASAGAGFEHQQTSVTVHLDPEPGAAGDVSSKAGPLPPPLQSGGR